MKKNYILKIALVAIMFLGKSFSGISQTDHERLINWLQTWQAAPLFEVNWGTAENLASCTGVTVLVVDGEERLQSLSLQGYGIVSELPQDIGALSYMEELNLSENYLIGSLPASMEELYNLHVLNLENNQLSGAVPSGLANLGALEQLNLMKNRFSGSIPSELGNLASLVRLELGYNRIMGTIPFSLGNLTNLEVLDLSVMGIAGDVPATLGKLVNLKELLLFGSIDLTGPVPPTLTNIAGLEKLYYANTGLCTPTMELFLDWLATVTDVVGNEGFCDCTDTDRYVLNQIARLTNVVDWTTSTNWQSALPLDQWHGVTTSEEGCVIRLELPANNVVGDLPEITFYMEGLQVLDLSENTLSGTIPNKVNIPSGFQHINLGDNQLSGNLPLELADLAALQYLDVSGNNLYGSIPAALKEPMVLEHLDLADNGFSGTIPETLGTLSGLQYLDLGHNNLIGQIPASLGGLVQLASLNLSHNLLEGEVPDALNALVLLDRLYLNDNWGLVGEVPVNFTALTELDSFHFHNTQLCEPEETAFQTWIMGITDLMSTGVYCITCAKNDREVLEEFYWSTGGPNWSNNTNWLSDEPLDSWHGITTNSDGCVTSIFLPSNKLQSDINTPAFTSKIGEIQTLEILYIPFNGLLKGEIPFEIGELQNLKTLVMAWNANITGSIPTSIGNLDNLEFATFLGCQKIIGSIPVEVGDLKSIRFLSFSLTGITGIFPDFLGNLTTLEELSLHGTSLTGCLPFSLTNLINLDQFNYWDSEIKEPHNDLVFMAWLNSIPNLNGTNQPCQGLAPQETSLQENREMMVQEQDTALVTATQSLKVVPNPAQELTSVSFEMENQGQAVITVLDLNGTEMYQSEQRLLKGFHEETINVGPYRKGIYIVNVETTQGIQQFKLIKE